MFVRFDYFAPTLQFPSFLAHKVTISRTATKETWPPAHVHLDRIALKSDDGLVQPERETRSERRDNKRQVELHVLGKFVGRGQHASCPESPADAPMRRHRFPEFVFV